MLSMEKLYRERDLQSEMKARSSRTRSVRQWPFFRLQPPTWTPHEREKKKKSLLLPYPGAQSLARIMFEFIAGEKKTQKWAFRVCTSGSLTIAKIFAWIWYLWNTFRRLRFTECCRVSREKKKTLLLPTRDNNSGHEFIRSNARRQRRIKQSNKCHNKAIW